MKNLRIFFVIFFYAIFLAGNLLAEGALLITAPPNNTVVHPGDTVQITVQVTTPSDFVRIGLAGEIFGTLGLGPPIPAASQL